MKKPNAHHKYWRYVLSSDPHRSEISTKTKVKYEAERIAKEAWAKAVEEADNCPLFKNYAADFFTGSCKYTARRMKSNKPFSGDVMKLKRRH